ncbi:hypothetical protein BDB01DRAFT_788933 [Pilobolus umbonatus]|nr:hypothetical protein BDB01DRAFT_788933 [Pilobolus umbonatus]
MSHPNKDEDTITEEYNEKTHLYSEEEYLHQDKQRETNLKDTPTTEMDHIFNQFDETGMKSDTVTTDTDTLHSTHSKEHPVPDTPQQELPFDYNRFLEQMRSRSSKPITKYYKSFLQHFDRRVWTVNEQIKIIQDFLDFIYVKMRECGVWKEMTEQEFGNAKEGMEKLVMNRLHSFTFSPATTDDKERDEIVHQKISIFRWIRETHLDIPETEHNDRFLSFAEQEILKINNYRAPRDKLICILNCCKVIFGLIKYVEGDGGADKFLPILIYVVIRANPPQLVSNVQYIYRFRNSEQLQAESGYYLTNLMGAISFIESMEAKSLSITKEEFDRNIEVTMKELQNERPKLTNDKQQVNYDNAFHPSRLTRSHTQPLLESAKAAAFLEKGSMFAQKTMQRPLSFVGKIFQGLSDNNETSRPGSPVEDDAYNGYPAALSHPPLPPRPLSNEQLALQKKQFEDNLGILHSMFTNMDDGVCYIILQANRGNITKSIDDLLDISNNESKNKYVTDQIKKN